MGKWCGRGWMLHIINSGKNPTLRTARMGSQMLPSLGWKCNKIEKSKPFFVHAFNHAKGMKATSHMKIPLKAWHSNSVVHMGQNKVGNTCTIKGLSLEKKFLTKKNFQQLPVIIYTIIIVRQSLSYFIKYSCRHYGPPWGLTSTTLLSLLTLIWSHLHFGQENIKILL